MLAKNNGENHLHGGLKGFDKVVWNAEPYEVEGGIGLRLTYHSLDGEEGYPGNLSVQVDYILTDNNELVIEYNATTDKKTHVNLTHHSYFNLCGNSKRDILDHELMIAAEGFLAVDKNLIPLGEVKPVASTPFDFRIAKPIGLDINVSEEQLKNGQGYDHNWVLFDKAKAKTENIRNQEVQLAATVYEPESGRFMEVFTSEPGMQFYSGNFLDGNYKGKYGVVYQDRFGFCLETQHFPDSPNQPAFPSTLLLPGQMYRSVTVYRFSVK
jgi:aldose 1-epimerase